MIQCFRAMKYQFIIVLFCVISFASAMEPEIVPAKYVKEFDETIGKILAKETITTDEQAWIYSSVQKFNKSTFKSDTRLLNRFEKLLSIRTCVSLQNMDEYNQQSAKYLEIWLKKNEPIFIAPNQKQAIFFGFFTKVCKYGQPGMLPILFKYTKQKRFDLFMWLIQGYKDYSDELIQKIKTNAQKNEKLALVKQTLLPIYFKGMHYLLEAGLDPKTGKAFFAQTQGSYEFEPPIIKAVEYLLPEFVSFLLRLGVDPHCNNNCKKESAADILRSKKNCSGMDTDQDIAILQIDNIFKYHDNRSKIVKLRENKNHFLSFLPQEIFELLENYMYGVQV